MFVVIGFVAGLAYAAVNGYYMVRWPDLWLRSRWTLKGMWAYERPKLSDVRVVGIAQLAFVIIGIITLVLVAVDSLR